MCLAPNTTPRHEQRRRLWRVAASVTGGLLSSVLAVALALAAQRWMRTVPDMTQKRPEKPGTPVTSGADNPREARGPTGAGRPRTYPASYCLPHRAKLLAARKARRYGPMGPLHHLALYRALADVHMHGSRLCIRPGRGSKRAHSRWRRTVLPAAAAMRLQAWQGRHAVTSQAAGRTCLWLHTLLQARRLPQQADLAHWPQQALQAPRPLAVGGSGCASPPHSASVQPAACQCGARVHAEAQQEGFCFAHALNALVGRQLATGEGLTGHAAARAERQDRLLVAG
jgi:hypothetical protein